MVDTQQFREVMGNFAAGVTVVTLPEPHHGITVNAFASLSLDPTLVLVCIDRGTDTYERLSGGDEGYCVNILADDQRHLGEYFAGMTELDDTPFETEDVSTAVTGAAVFEDALAYLDCSLYEAFEGGDHVAYVGEVEEAEILRPEAPALTYFRGEWSAIGG